MLKNLMDIGLNMINGDKYIKLFLKSRLRSFNLNATEGLIILLFLREEKHNEGKNVGMTQERILQELQYDKGVMTRAMQSLEKKGFVTRQKNPKDGRSFIFTLSEMTKSFKEEIYMLVNEWAEAVLKDINPEQVIMLNDLIQKVSDNAWDYYNKLNK